MWGRCCSISLFSETYYCSHSDHYVCLSDCCIANQLSRGSQRWWKTIWPYNAKQSWSKVKSLLDFFLYKPNIVKPFPFLMYDRSSWYIWIHIVLSILFVPLAIGIMRHFSRRLDIPEEESTVSRTLMINHIPRNRCNKADLLQHFKYAINYFCIVSFYYKFF